MIPKSRVGVSRLVPYLYLLLTACSSDSVAPTPVPPDPVARVVVSSTATEIQSRATITFTASIQNAQGRTLSGRSVTWSTSDATLATVSADGVVTAGVVTSGTPRPVVLSASSEGVSGTATISVLPAAVSRILLTPDSVIVAAGLTTRLVAFIKDSAGVTLTSRAVIWSSSNATIATVSDSGLVTTLAYLGGSTRTLTITASSEGKSAVARLTVTPLPVSRIVLTPDSVAVTAGRTTRLVASAKDSTGITVTDRPITWSSSNATIATVSDSGLVTTLAYFGGSIRTLTITATSGGRSAAAQLTVTPVPVARVTVTPASSSVAESDTLQMFAVATDSAGTVLTGRSFTWSTTSSIVATVSTTGRLIATPYGGSATRGATVNVTSEGRNGSAAVSVFVDLSRASAFFTLVPNAFPDLSSYFNAIAYPVGTFSVAGADVNRDGREDLVFHYSHSAFNPLPQAAFAPIQNRVITLLANSDGTFADRTQQLFGSMAIDVVGALSRNVAVADVNGDGYPDWIYALNREDGRSCTQSSGSGGCVNWFTQSAGALSRGDGTYAIVPFGPTAYQHGVATARTATGAYDIILDYNAYSVAGNSFVPTAPYPFAGFTFSPAATVAGGTTDLWFTEDGRQAKPSTLQLHTRSGAGSWSQRGAFEFSSFRQIQWITWSADLGPAYVVNYRGRELVGGAFYNTCALRLTPGQPPVFLASFNTTYYPGGIANLTVVRQGDMTPIALLMAFRADATQLTEIPIVSDPVGVFFSLTCADLNGDGYDDVFSDAGIDGEKPLIFLNTRAGTLTKLLSARLPPPPRGWQARAWLADTDGDGIKDLIYYPGGCFAPSGCARFQLWKGRRPLQ